MQQRKALVVGINGYASSPLKGAVADAEEIAGLLEFDHAGHRNWDVTPLVGDLGPVVVTQDVLERQLVSLFEAGSDTDALLYFAGHAVTHPWGSTLLTQDMLGFGFNDLLSLINDSNARTVSVILDCCAAGELADVSPGRQQVARRRPAEPFLLPSARIREGVAILTASRSYQVSTENQDTSGGEVRGAFTRLLVDGLSGTAADIRGRVTMLSLYDHASEAFGVNAQRPLLKANVATPPVLVETTPRVTDAQLRQLVTLFPRERREDGKWVVAGLQLSLKHEGGDPHGGPQRDERYQAFLGRPGESATDEQKELDLLKVLRGIGMVTSPDDRDFWECCNLGLFVHLTPLGQYYRNLVENKRL